MKTLSRTATISIVSLFSLGLVVPNAFALPVATSVGLTGYSVASDSNQGNDSSTSTAMGQYTGTPSGYAGSVLVSANAQNPTLSSPVSLNQSAALSVSNSQTTSDPWNPAFIDGALQSKISSLDFLIGSYSGATGTQVNGVLLVDLSVAVSSQGDHNPVIVTTSGLAGPEQRVNFSQYPNSPLATSLWLRSNISLVLDDKTAGTRFSGNVDLRAGDLAANGAQSVAGSTVLEIPFTTYVGSTLSFDALLKTYFNLRWYSVWEYNEEFTLSIEDPITLNLLTPDAYYYSAAGPYFGPDQYTPPPAAVSEPNVIALVVIALLLVGVFSQRKRRGLYC